MGKKIPNIEIDAHRKRIDTAQADDLDIVLRAATEEDINFIMDSWKKSFVDNIFTGIYNVNKRHKIPFHKLCNINILIHGMASTILNRTSALIVCDANDYSHIIGYIVAEFIDGVPAIHWIYVKHWARRKGVAKLLYNAANPNRQQCFASFVTDPVKDLLEKYNIKTEMFYFEELMKHNTVPIVGRIKNYEGNES